MLKTTRSIGSVANLKENKGKDNGDSVVGDMVGGNEATNSIKGKYQAKTTKSKILV